MQKKSIIPVEKKDFRKYEEILYFVFAFLCAKNCMWKIIWLNYSKLSHFHLALPNLQCLQCGQIKPCQNSCENTQIFSSCVKIYKVYSAQAKKQLRLIGKTGNLLFPMPVLNAVSHWRNVACQGPVRLWTKSSFSDILHQIYTYCPTSFESIQAANISCTIEQIPLAEISNLCFVIGRNSLKPVNFACCSERKCGLLHHSYLV